MSQSKPELRNFSLLENLNSYKKRVVRGGRLTKVAGRAASYAPCLGLALSQLGTSVSAIAIGAAAITVSSSHGAEAGNCVAGTGPNEYFCSGAASGSDTTIDITSPTASVSTTSGFGLSPATGEGLSVTTTGGLSIVDDHSSSIVSEDTGVYAGNYGTGDLNITLTGSITSTSGSGVRTFNSSGNTSVSVNNVTTASNLTSIFSYHNGSGNLEITSTGTVDGGVVGVAAISSGADTTINVVDVNSSYQGISAYHVGSGDLTITSTGTITTGSVPYGPPSVGVMALSTGTNLTINVNEISSGHNGVLAYNEGTGALTVTATGTITTTESEDYPYSYFSGYGITAVNGYYGGYGGGPSAAVRARPVLAATDVIVNVADVTSASSGILALNYGSGEVSVTASGTVVGQTGDGIIAVNLTGTNTSVNAVDVSGYYSGIIGYSGGSGALTITSTGTVTGHEIYGIGAFNGYDGTDMTINSVDVSGGEDGIKAESRGSGALTVTSTGTVTATDGDGINVDGYATGTNVTVNAHNVTASDQGIDAHNYGTGALTVNATGSVTGTTEEGIHAYGSSNGTDITVSAKDVSGATDGIYIENFGSGDTTVTATGTVVGGTGAGITIVSANNTSITVNSGATISATSGPAISSGDGATSLTIEDGATINGEIVLGTSDDTVRIEGSLSGITLLDAGGSLISLSKTFARTSASSASNNALTLSGFSGAFSTTPLVNWDSVTLDGSAASLTEATWSIGDPANASSGLFLTNGTNLDASNAFALTGNLGIDAASMLTATGNGAGLYSVSSDLNNQGTISMQDDQAGDALTVAGDYSGGGRLALDVDLGQDTADVLKIGGDVLVGGTEISATNVTYGQVSGNDLNLVEVSGSTADGDFSLAGGPLSVGVYVYDLELQSSNWSLARDASLFSEIAAVYETAPALLLASFSNFSSLEQRVGNRQWWNRDYTENRAGMPTEGAWFKATGDWSEITASDSDSGASSETKSWALDFGLDFEAEESEKGRWVYGITGRYGKVDSNIWNSVGSGTLDSTGLGVGVTATWYGTSGSYVDMQGQANWLTVDLGTSAQGALATGEDAIAIGLSAEVGHAYALSEETNLIPQAQLTIGHLSGSSFTDSQGSTIAFGDNTSILGRLGVAYEYTSTEENRLSEGEKFYVIGNLLHDFSDNTSVNVNDVSLSAQNDATWAEIGIGGSTNLNEKTNAYFEGNYRQQVTDGGSNNGYSVTAGFRMSF